MPDTSMSPPGLFATYANSVADRAHRKGHWLRLWRDRCNSRRPGECESALAAAVVEEAKRVEGDGFPISVRSLQAWHLDYIRGGVEALIDGRGAAPGGPPCGPPRGGGRSAEAIEHFYSIYRCDNKPSRMLCHEATLVEARKQGWAWPASYAATTRWLRERDDVSLTYLLRYGKRRWAKRFLPHIEVDYSGIGPGGLYVADHHECDWWVTYKDKQIRPWVTAVQDCRSRCIVGWHLGPAPHTDAIVAAMRRAFTDWAIPERMRIDNGKDYTSRTITGVTKAEGDRFRRELGQDWKRFITRNAAQDSPIDSRWLGIAGELGIDLIYAIPYAPWSKGTLERWFGTMEGRFGKTVVTYCGNDALNRPECLEQIRRGYTDEQRRRLKKQHGDEWRRHALLKLVDQRDIPTLEESRGRLGEYIEAYHRTAHRGEDMHGASPLEVWQTATSLRRAVGEALVCLMETKGIYRVGANGVTVTVGSARLHYGKRSAALKPYVGRDVLVSVNPDDVSYAWAFTAEREGRRPLGRLEANERIDAGTCTDEVREAIAEQMRERKVMHQAARSSARRTRTATQRINAHRREALAALRRTGTDAADSVPAIVPVRTGFEGASTRAQTSVEYRPVEPDDLADLFDDSPRLTIDTDELDGMEALFRDEPAADDEAAGLEVLL